MEAFKFAYKVGLISDEKLVDLLDLALSADTVNIVKCLRELMDVGVEPLALMSQLATLITDILAGSYRLPKRRHRRKFFRRETLSKEEMERLRQALKTLSEAEKQLRLSNDRTTWLTAALLQLAPDQSYILPSSSTGTSFAQSPVAQNYSSEKEIADKESRGTRQTHRDNHSETMQHFKESRATNKSESIPTKRARGPSLASHGGSKTKGHPSSFLEGKKKLENDRDFKISGEKDIPASTSAYSVDISETGQRQFICRSPTPTAKLLFSHQEHKARAEKFRASILQAFQSALGCPVEIQISCAPTKEGSDDLQVGLVLTADQSNTSDVIPKLVSSSADHALQIGGTDFKNGARNRVSNAMSSDEQRSLQSHVQKTLKSEIVEDVQVFSSPQGCIGSRHAGSVGHLDEKRLESAWLQEPQSSPHLSMFGPYRPEKHRNVRERLRTKSLAKSKVSLGYVIQQEEGNIDRFNQDHNDRAGGWPKKRGISIAEKLEQENLRLESRSGGHRCWKVARAHHKKGKHFRTRPKRSRIFLRLVPCGKCPCVKSSR